MTTPSPIEVPSHQALSRLAADDPPAFEALCSTLVERCIGRAPERIQPRLRQIQFRVDGIRRRSRSPLGALIKIQALMWESFLQMDQELQHWVRLTSDAPHLTVRETPMPAPARCTARVIEFPGRTPRRTG